MAVMYLIFLASGILMKAGTECNVLVSDNAAVHGEVAAKTILSDTTKNRTSNQSRTIGTTISTITQSQQDTTYSGGNNINTSTKLNSGVGPNSLLLQNWLNAKQRSKRYRRNLDFNQNEFKSSTLMTSTTNDIVMDDNDDVVEPKAFIDNTINGLLMADELFADDVTNTINLNNDNRLNMNEFVEVTNNEFGESTESTTDVDDITIIRDDSQFEFGSGSGPPHDIMDLQNDSPVIVSSDLEPEVKLFDMDKKEIKSVEQKYFYVPSKDALVSSTNTNDIMNGKVIKKVKKVLREHDENETVEKINGPYKMKMSDVIGNQMMPKRIMVNVSIATDTADGRRDHGIYTLYVSVPLEQAYDASTLTTVENNEDDCDNTVDYVNGTMVGTPSPSPLPIEFPLPPPKPPLLCPCECPVCPNVTDNFNQIVNDTAINENLVNNEQTESNNLINDTTIDISELIATTTTGESIGNDTIDLESTTILPPQPSNCSFYYPDIPPVLIIGGEIDYNHLIILWNRYNNNKIDDAAFIQFAYNVIAKQEKERKMAVCMCV